LFKFGSNHLSEIGGTAMEVTTTQYKRCDLVTAMEALTNNGRYKIVLDMSGVEFMSSAGLRVLISTQKSCKRFNRGEVVLACVPQRIFEALDLAGFVPLFRFFDNLTAAVASF
jgi:anti-sigma B factor antagonist